MTQKITKRSLLFRVLLGIGVILASLFSVLIAAIGFFVSARLISSIRWIIFCSAAILTLSAGGLAWLITGSEIFSAIYALVVLLLMAIIANRIIFRPVQATGTSPQPRADMRYWHLQTGSQIAYTLFPAVGAAKPAPLVYLHGGPAVPIRAANYDFYRQFSEDSYDVYLYDQVGSGLSAHLPDIREYTLARHVADLEAIRQQIGAQQVTLAGTSWGAVLAAHYLAAYPENVAAVVFISPGVLGDRRKLRYDHARTAAASDDSIILPPLRMIVAGMLARINPTAAQQFATQSELNSLYDSFITDPSLEYQGHCRGYQPETTVATRSSGGNYYANLLTLQSLKKAADPRPNLQGNQTPALVLRGECDYIPWEATYRYKQTLPNARLLLIPGAGHALIGAQPGLALASIRAFLTGQSLPLPAYDSSQPPY